MRKWFNIIIDHIRDSTIFGWFKSHTFVCAFRLLRLRVIFSYTLNRFGNHVVYTHNKSTLVIMSSCIFSYAHFTLTSKTHSHRQISQRFCNAQTYIHMITCMRTHWKRARWIWQRKKWAVRLHLVFIRNYLSWIKLCQLDKCIHLEKWRDAMVKPRALSIC